MFHRRQILDRQFGGVGHALQLQPTLAALELRVGGFAQQPGTGRQGNAVGLDLRPLARAHGPAQQHEYIGLGAQHARRISYGLHLGLGHAVQGQSIGHHAALIPAGVRGQDQGGDLPGRGACRMHCSRGIRANLGGLRAGSNPVRDAAG